MTEEEVKGPQVWWLRKSLSPLGLSSADAADDASKRADEHGPSRAPRNHAASLCRDLPISSPPG